MSIPFFSKFAQKRYLPLFVSILAGIAFIGLSVIRLDAQGLYYDELFQAVSSFAYIGHVTHHFATLEFHNLPIMNMSYIGAIKTGIYGLYLLITNQSFSVVSWRLLGILFPAVGIMIFGIIVRKRLSLIGLVIFLFLLLTDITLILTSRFDWGPVALSSLLRMLLIAVWLEGELSGDPHPINVFWMGLLFGISIFEKLNNIVLVVPIMFMVLSNPIRRNFRHLKASLLGGSIGIVPLILANLLSFYKTGKFITLQLQNVLTSNPHSFGGLIKTIEDYLSLGAGYQVQSFILGVDQHLHGLVETILLATLLFLMLIGMISYGKRNSIYFRLSMVMILSYFSVILILFFIPAPISTHHWITATPFQYVAIAMFLLGLVEQNSIKFPSLFGIVFIISLLLLAFSRISGIVTLEQSFQQGDASYKWDHSLTTIGEFAAEQADHAIFIAADWGVANQMICFLNGKSGVVYEFPGLDNNNVDQVLQIVQNTQKDDVYLVVPNPPYFTTIDTRELLLSDITSFLGLEWNSQPIDQQVEGLRSVKVYKFSKVLP